MRNLFLVLLTVLSVNVFAAKYHIIKQSQLMNFDDLAKTWSALVQGEDTEMVLYQIDDKKENEPWKNTLKQLHYGKYVEQVEVKSESCSLSRAKSLVKALDEANGNRMSGSEDIGEKGLEKIAKKVYEACQDETVSIYSGSLSGAFDSSRSLIILVDEEHDQVISLGAGYTE